MTVERERAHWNEAASGNPDRMRALVGGDPSLDVWGDVYDLVDDVEVALDVHSGGTYVEVGCGPGRLLGPLSLRNPQARWFGLDVAGALLQLLPIRRNIGVLTGDGRTIPLDDASVDGAFCVTVFQHLQVTAVAGYLAELGRVVRPGGKILVQYVRDDDQAFSGEWLHYRYSDLWVGTGLTDAGFSITRVDDVTAYGWSWVRADRMDR